MISKTASPPARPQSGRPRQEADTPGLFSTKNDLPAQTRTQLVNLLNGRLADSIDLQTQC
jgi:hypothetical protein